MDCVIPGHSVRSFSASIGCLGRIGKELYVDFDPLDGLTLRTLNDAKSAFASFHFEPTFFERCSASPRTPLERQVVGGSKPTSSSSLRSSSALSKRRLRHRESGGNRRNEQGGKEREGDDDDDDGEKYVCRVPVRTVHSVLRSRKGIRSLRIRSSNGSGGSSRATNTLNEERGDDEEDNNGLLMQLSFEFRIENPKNGGIMRVVHRVGVSDADGVMAVAPKDGCSEIIVAPKVVLRMLEPLKRTAEVALTISDELKVVTATSFHHGDTAAALSSDNALLNAAAPAVLKTETSIGCDEFEEFTYRDDRDNDGSLNDGCNEGTDIPPPARVNKEVTLVFGIKEAKAMLQFCSQANLEEELRVVLSFHWGGKPILFETEGESFSAQLIMATLDHKLLGGIGSSRNQKGGCSENGRKYSTSAGID